MDDTQGNGNGNGNGGDVATTTETPAARHPRRLVRVRRGRVWCGVAAGLGAYTGTDPVLWRIGFVVLTIFTGGMAALAYLVLWLVMPEEGEDHSVLEGGTQGLRLPDRHRTRRWLGIGAVVLGALILLDDVWHLGGGLVLGLLLVGAGVALWGRELVDEEGPAAPPDRAPEPPSTAGSQAEAPSHPGATEPPDAGPPAPSGPPAAGTEEHPRPRRRRRRSALGRIVLGAAALVVGAGLLLDALGAIDLTAEGVMAALLVVTGLGLVVGAWWGRARWLILPGIVLVLALAAAAVVPLSLVDVGDGAGERHIRPESLTALRPEYRLGVGQMTIDLSDLDFDGRRRDVEARVGLGQIGVVVPRDVTVLVEARTGAGEVDLFGGSEGGLGVRSEVRRAGDRDAGRLVLELRAGMGQIIVARDGSAVADEILEGRYRGSRRPTRGPRR